MRSFIRLLTRRTGCDQQRCECDDSWGKKLRCTERVLIFLSLRVRLAKSQRDREICAWHHGSHVHVVNVEIDFPFSIGVLPPSLKVSLSGGNRLAPVSRHERQSMPAIIKSRIVEHANGYDSHNKSRVVSLKKLRRARPKHRLGVGTKEARRSGAHICKLVREHRQEAIHISCVVGFPKT